MFKKIFIFLRKFAIPILFFFILFGLVIFNLKRAGAGTAENVFGWAWSENIGWISFNSKNCEGKPNCTCPSKGAAAGCPNLSYLCSNPCADLKNYGVHICESDADCPGLTTGYLTGYAWSENIGWIQFDPPAPYPENPQYSVCLDVPTITTEPCNGIGDWQVSGWARALSYGDGWDGWIKLRGQDGPKQPTTLTLNPSGDDWITLNQIGCPDPAPGVTVHFKCVSDNNDDTYVYNATTSSFIPDLYHLSDTPPAATGTINSVTLYFKARSFGGTAQATSFISSMAGGQSGPSVDLTETWATYSRTHSTDFGNNPWTWSAINSLRAGIYLQHGTGEAQVTKVWVVVNYTPLGYGVSIETGVSPKPFHGWAWGSDVVGWISFNDLNIGAAVDYQVVTTVNFSPTASNPNETRDCCCYGCMSQVVPTPGGVTVTLNWTYSDPDGTPQTAYEILVDDDSDFGDTISPGRFNHLVDPSSSTTYLLKLSDDDECPVNCWREGNPLAWGTTYYWKVKVRDQPGKWSESAVDTFETPSHAWPYVVFTSSPQNPSVNEIVQFTNISECYDTNGNVISCGSFPWSWSFPADWQFETSSSSSSQNPSGKFTTPGSKTISLTVTDSDGFNCTGSKDVNVTFPLPEWKEIPPL